MELKLISMRRLPWWRRIIGIENFEAEVEDTSTGEIRKFEMWFDEERDAEWLMWCIYHGFTSYHPKLKVKINPIDHIGQTFTIAKRE